MNPINLLPDTSRFAKLVNDSAIKQKLASNLTDLSIDQRDVFVKTIQQNVASPSEQMQSVLTKMMSLIDEGDSKGAMALFKKCLPDDAAMSKTSLGTAIMAKDWEMPIVFPDKGNFKWLGFADNPAKLTTDRLWQEAYGKTPSLIMGAVGNSNIKPEQVLGGCAMSKKELSRLYEDSVATFFRPIIKYLKELGAKKEDIGFAFAHSDCGVDKAAREVIEEHGLKGLATTPTMYTQYLRGVQMPATKELPNGYILADFPYPTVLTRNLEQVDDYAETYNTMLGAKNPLGVFGGGEHAFKKDVKEAIFGQQDAISIPVDIMKDMHGIVIPAKDKNGAITNAAANYIERINESPYKKYERSFENLPHSQTWANLRQYDPQKAFTSVACERLAEAGKIKL